MKSPCLKLASFRRVILVILLSMAWSALVHGQVSALKDAVQGKDSSPSSEAEKPEALKKRIEQWLNSARETLAVLDAPNAASLLPEGISQADLDQRRRNLEGMILVTTRWLKSIDTPKKATPTQAEAPAWTGFKETPPYSILMLDELLNVRDGIKTNLTSNQSSLANYEHLLQSLIGETKSAEDEVSAKFVEAQKADEAASAATKWRLEAAREKSRLLAARSGAFENNCQNLKDRIAVTNGELALIDKKIAVAKSNVRFTEEDLTKLQKISTERKQAISQEAEVIAKRVKAAKLARNQAQTALDALVASAPAGKDPEGLDLARFRVEVTQGRLDSLQFISEWLDGLPSLENLGVEAYQIRRTILTTTGFQERAVALDSLRDILERIQAWENVINTEVASSEADLSQLESRVASVPEDDPRHGMISEQRATKSEKLILIQRVSQSVTTLRKLVKRWITEHSPKTENSETFPRVKLLASNGWMALKGLWGFELMSFKESIVVDGQTITGNIPFTLGSLLRALLFFVICYWIASRIAGRIQRSLVSRGHIAEAQAKTLRNWAMIVVSVFLVIGTLSFLKIPLTVFAFFGGALAIGLGFGMQTLIKNFISGIIVLAERKVRVGDVLDVDGIIGSVTEINTRSSIIRGADDVETMIPNSLFLENRVTNWTLSSSRMRRNLRVGVAYGTQPQQVIEVLTESAARHGLIRKSPEPFAVLDDFGDSSLIFTLYFWLNIGEGTNPSVVASDLRIMIVKRFAELEIGFSFPQRDMHLSTTEPLQVEWTGKSDEPTLP